MPLLPTDPFFTNPFLILQVKAIQDPQRVSFPVANKQSLRQRQDALLAVYEAATRELMQFPGVLAVGLGLKETGGRLSDQLAFRVYVQEKKAPADLAANERIPPNVQGFPTDVLKIYRIQPAADFVERRDMTEYRPLQGGISISSKEMTARTEHGTLGWFARKKSDNSRVLLTNCHVLYPDIVTDDPPTVRTAADKVGQPIYKHVCCCECNVIGSSIIGLKNKFVDCALASINADTPVSLFIHNNQTTHTLRVDGTDTAVVGDVVRKIGARSGYTRGRVIDLGGAAEGAQITLPNGQQTHVRVNQIIIWPADDETYIDDHFGAVAFFNEGDSGSVILDSENKIIGLGFASHYLPNHSLCIANHIGNVLQHLKDNGHEILLEVSPPGGGDAPALSHRGARTLVDLLADCPTTLRTLVEKHRREVFELIEHCRPVTVAWRRGQGPAFAAAVARSNRDPHYRIPAEFGGVRRAELLSRLAAALTENGSEALKNDLALYGPVLIEILQEYKTVRGMTAAFAQTFEPQPMPV